MHIHEDEPTDEYPEEYFDEQTTPEEAVVAEVQQGPTVRKLGKFGRRRATEQVARAGNVIHKSNKTTLKEKFAKIDDVPKALDLLPYDPIGHRSVPGNHQWALAHASHKLIVVHSYAAC